MKKPLYPDSPLGPQLHPLGSRLSAWDVVLDHFFPNRVKPMSEDEGFGGHIAPEQVPGG